RLELTLPGCVRHVRGTRGDLATSIEIEKLDRHLLNRGARLLALLRPSTAAEMVQSRRRRVLRDVVRRAISLELVDTIERNVETISALVPHDGDLDRAPPDEDRLDAAIDADAVLEVHDEIAGLERQRVDRRRGGVPARAADAPLAAEDLVVGENAERLRD